MGRAVGFMDDLFFQMKIAETAKHVGVDFKVASTGEALMGMLEAPTKLVIIDLNAKNQPLATLESHDLPQYNAYFSVKDRLPTGLRFKQPVKT